MSKLPERLMFLHPGMYSSEAFRVKHVITKVSNPPSKKYFTHGDLMMFNLGAAPNQFVIPETAFLCFSAKVSANTLPASEVADPWADPIAVGGYSGRTPFGLPRIDYGVPFFDQINADIDSSKNIVNINGAALCRAVLNGRIASASMTMVPDVLDTVKDVGLQPIDCYNSTGPASLCGFTSNSTRVRAYSGIYRGPTNTPTYNARFGYTNGANNYKIPLSLIHGLLDAYASSWLPLGMLSQSSASGLTLKFRIAKKEDVLIDSKVAKSILPGTGFYMGNLVQGENQMSVDGKTRTVAFDPSALPPSVAPFANNSTVYMYDPTANGAPGAAADFEDLTAATTYVKNLLRYLQERNVSEFYPDGRGATVDGAFAALFEPVIVYRVVEILDENLLNLLRASFNGQNVESVELAGQVINVPKLLNIKYRGYNYTQQIYPTGVSNMVWNIPMTQPSFRGLMIRFAPQADEGTAKDSTKSADPDVVITKFQVKIGTAVYPLTPIESVNISGFTNPAPASSADIRAVQDNFLSSADTVAYAHLAGLQEDARALFSPWYDTEGSDNIEDFTFNEVLTVGSTDAKDRSGLMSRIKPLMITFDNHTNYEKEKLDNAATGVDMRGIGSYTIELSLREPGSNSLSLTTKPYNVFIVDCYDAVMSVKRNAVDSEYQFALF